MNEPEILRFLSGNGLSVTEFHILSTIHYGPHPAERLVRVAASESGQWFGRLPSASLSECTEALASLLSKGLLQVIDEHAIARIDADLLARPAYNLKGLPEPGEIDFTQEGGRLWHRLGSEVFDPGGTSGCCGYGELNEDLGTFRTEYLGAREQDVKEAVASDLAGNSSEVISIQGPDPIGAWRDYWWDDVHQQGYRMVVVERPVGSAPAKRKS